MPLDPGMIDACLCADYAAIGKPERVLRIGEPSADLGALLEAERAETACHVTAANPSGRRASDAEDVLAKTARRSSAFRSPKPGCWASATS